MKALTRKPPNPGLQRTALCAHKIGAILTVGFSPTVFPIYDCAAAEAQPVGRQSISACAHPTLSIMLQLRSGTASISTAKIMFQQTVHERTRFHDQYAGEH